MPTYRQPTTEPTPVENARLVVIGGSRAGIHRVVEGYEGIAPLTEYAGPCFPLSVYCRSLAEAETVWQLQSIAQIMERESEQKVAAAFITSVVVCHLFNKDETAVFHAAFLGFYRRPMVFFSWADAYPYAQCFPDSKVQRVKTFVDAIIWLCLRPRSSVDLEHAVEFVRPQPLGRIVLVGDSQVSLTQAASQKIEASPPIASTSASVLPVVAISDSERAASGMPTWVSDILWNAEVSADTIFYRTRNIKGELLRSYKSAPADTVLVPSLGAIVDIVVDGLGFTPDTIRRLHTTFIDARQLSSSHNGWFLNTMAKHHMSLVEAAMFWGLIRVPNGTTFQYREKYVFKE
ncbi:hypothetical protein QCA50_005665 [Cerrena zonata]|uniref:Uncharacterized protein n=1 Tax=Cerrena zonata TaxID=2478898 RepID=A0AAW0G041_9APHY